MSQTKKILLITGSPRSKGNSTTLANALAKGAEEKGHTILRFDSAKNNVLPCTACDACWSKGTPCIFNDGFTELAPLLEQADVIVFASPVYWGTFSTQIKSAIDKFYSYMAEKSQTSIAGKQSILLMTGAEKEESLFTGCIETYKAMLHFLKWNDLGSIIAKGLWAEGDIESSDYLAKAEALGKSL